jgi:hypothetical protein
MTVVLSSGEEGRLLKLEVDAVAFWQSSLIEPKVAAQNSSSSHGFHNNESTS